ncbi:hypothetical protein Ancab_018097 [Ancistrocladus abbreviatus]
MKLATVNPRLTFYVDDLLEAFPACPGPSFLTTGVSPDMANQSYLHYNPVQQMGPASGPEVGVSSVDIGLRRSISTPVSVPEKFIDSSCFTQIQSSLPWDADLPSFFAMDFQQARPNSFPSETFSGAIEAGNLKMEM